MFSVSRLTVHYLKRTTSNHSNNSSLRDEDNLFLIVEDKRELNEGKQKEFATMRDAPVDAQRQGIRENNKWLLFFLTTSLMLFLTIWLLFFHVSEDGLYYPKNKFHKRIPVHWIERAILYNSFTYDEYYNYTVINPSAKVMLQEAATSDNNPKSKVEPMKSMKLVCYYNFPDESFAKLNAPNIEPNLCTHINIAFATVVDSQLHLTEQQLNVTADVMKLKEKNKSLKVLISVGGAGNDKGFPNMVKDHGSRKLFIKSILDFVKQYKFDGVDLDWEFPATNASPKTKQRMHFTQLLHEIRNEINRQEQFKFLLSVAVAAPIFIVDIAYDVSYMNEYVDYVNLMTYDYHFFTKLTPYTGMNAPLYTRENDIGYFATLSINYTVHYWMLKGIQRDKIIVGLPTYGHSFRLVNVFNHGITAPANNYGTLGFRGFVGYNELCIFLRKNKITPMFDLPTCSPFATRQHEWVSFDDQQSLMYKTEYIKNQQLGGAMVYALNTDDHQGVCTLNSTRRFPLTKTIKYILTN